MSAGRYSHEGTGLRVDGVVVAFAGDSCSNGLCRVIAYLAEPRVRTLGIAFDGAFASELTRASESCAVDGERAP